ncbi:auxin efflux carrier [Exophiala viscosa]|uniref:auxin efflux carrier n=1 Tax=Exophiala viscosa TaxID=2486360 RepID=UPI002192211C|nr:auxin efflux carrier [Exophiala viscosa]
MAPTGLLDSFLAAIQASLSVLLVIFYGGIAAHLKLLTPANTKAISKVCVRMFLPALLVTSIGSELHAGSAKRYGIILIWAIICHLISFLIGVAAHLWMGMPDWTTVALMFNNTTSYPLLLIAALQQTGILQSLIVSDESTAKAVERAKSYFLVFATISSCLTFAVGPRLIDTEHPPEHDKEAPEVNGHGDLEAGAGAYDADPDDDDEEVDPLDPHGATEQTGLLNSRPSVSFASNTFLVSKRRPSVAATPSQEMKRRPSVVPKRHWVKLGPRAKWWLLFIADFFNAPLLGAILGAIIGLIRPLHRSFFNDTYQGGIFTAWLTSSWQSIGGLFVPLPVVVAGVSLYTAMRDARRNSATTRANTKLPWITVAFIMVIRFVIWPVASIALIYALATRTSILGEDPMLWFAMMLMPTGPPAMKLITLIQVSDADEAEERNISKLLTLSYAISPILSFTVVGALRASQAAI